MRSGESRRWRPLVRLLAAACILWLHVDRAAAEPFPAGDLFPPDTGDRPLSIRGYDQRLQAGIDLIYSLQFEEANRYFEAVIRADPQNPLGYFFRAMVSWWRVLIDLEDRSHDEVLFDHLQECIDVCDQRLKEDPDHFDAIFFKGGSIGFRGRLRGDRGQFLKAAGDGLRSIPLLKRSRTLEPANKDLLFGQGIYDYFAEVMPERHPIIRPVMWFLEKGDKDKGLRELDEVARSGRYARVEAKYFLAQIYRIFEGDPARALTYLEQLNRQYPDNSIFHRNTARTLVELGRWEKALGLYREFIRRSDEGRTGYHVRGRIESLFYIGKRAFQHGRAQQTVEVLAAADSLSHTLGKDRKVQAVRGYIPLANLYLGMAYDELERRELALERYRRVRKLPKYGRSHELAKKYQKRAYTRGPGQLQPAQADPSLDPPTPMSKNLE